LLEILVSSLNPHKKNLWSSPVVEIFPIFISRKKSKAIQIYGSVEVSINGEGRYYIFKRDEKDAICNIPDF
jgi:hypothetical protein